MAGQGTGQRGWDWCSSGLWHRGDSQVQPEQDMSFETHLPCMGLGETGRACTGAQTYH